MVGSEIDPHFRNGYGVSERQGYADCVLCSGYDDFGAVFGRGAEDLRKITCCVSVMVREAQ